MNKLRFAAIKIFSAPDLQALSVFLVAHLPFLWAIVKHQEASFVTNEGVLMVAAATTIGVVSTFCKEQGFDTQKSKWSVGVLTMVSMGIGLLACVMGHFSAVGASTVAKIGIDPKFGIQTADGMVTACAAGAILANLAILVYLLRFPDLMLKCDRTWARQPSSKLHKRWISWLSHFFLAAPLVLGAYFWGLLAYVMFFSICGVVVVYFTSHILGRRQTEALVLPGCGRQMRRIFLFFGLATLLTRLILSLLMVFLKEEALTAGFFMTASAPLCFLLSWLHAGLHPRSPATYRFVTFQGALTAILLYEAFWLVIVFPYPMISTLFFVLFPWVLHRNLAALRRRHGHRMDKILQNKRFALTSGLCVISMALIESLVHQAGFPWNIVMHLCYGLFGGYHGYFAARSRFLQADREDSENKLAPPI